MGVGLTGIERSCRTRGVRLMRQLRPGELRPWLREVLADLATGNCHSITYWIPRQSLACPSNTPSHDHLDASWFTTQGN
jgi:hypothetical protein